MIKPSTTDDHQVGNYIMLYRKITSWEWYTDANTMRVFFHLLLNANWKDGRYRGYEVPRGSLVVGRKKLAKELKMSEQSVRTALEHLKSTNEITTKITNRFTIVTIVNYDNYQVVVDDSNHQNDQQPNQQSTNNQPTTNHNRINKDINKENNKSISKDILRPTSEVERVISEWNNLPEPIKKVQGLKPNTERYKMLTSRIKEYGIDSVIEAVHKVGESDFLRRGSDKGWQIDFGWFVRPNNFPKVLEGKYDNKDKPTASYISTPRDQWDSYMWSDAIKDGYVTQDDYREWRNGTL